MEERLLKLEKSNGRLKKYVAFIHIFLVGLVFLGFQNTENIFDKIETNKLILRDSKGIERAVLLIDSNDAVKFRFNDKNEKTKVSIGVQKDNKGYFGIWDEDRYLTYISEGDSSGGYIILRSKDSTLNNSVSLGIGDGKKGFIQIWGEERSLFYVRQNKFDGVEMDINIDDSTEKGNQVYLVCDTFDVSLTISDKESNTFSKLNKYSLSLYNKDKETTLGQRNKYRWVWHENSSTKDGHSRIVYKESSLGLSIYENNTNLFYAGLNSSTNGENDMSNILLANDNTSINFLNSKNKKGLSLNSSKDFSNFMIFDENEKTRFGVFSDYKKNQTSISIYDNTGNLRLNLGNQELSYPDGSSKTTAESSIYLFNSTGNSIFEAPQ